MFCSNYAMVCPTVQRSILPVVPCRQTKHGLTILIHNNLISPCQKAKIWITCINHFMWTRWFIICSVYVPRHKINSKINSVERFSGNQDNNRPTMITYSLSLNQFICNVLLKAGTSTSTNSPSTSLSRTLFLNGLSFYPISAES